MCQEQPQSSRSRAPVKGRTLFDWGLIGGAFVAYLCVAVPAEVFYHCSGAKQMMQKKALTSNRTEGSQIKGRQTAKKKRRKRGRRKKQKPKTSPLSVADVPTPPLSVDDVPTPPLAVSCETFAADSLSSVIAVDASVLTKGHKRQSRLEGTGVSRLAFSRSTPDT